jgi:acyl-coenzyme A synthetase/AMP-(fatty) acid ligase
MALWESLARAAGRPTGALVDVGRSVQLDLLERGSCLGGRLEALRGRSVVLAIRDQLVAALCLIELDGVAQRIVLCPPDLAADHLPHVVRSAQADAWIGDAARGGAPATIRVAVEVTADSVPQPASRSSSSSVGRCARRPDRDTEWVLLTSGTTGAPKLVLHTLASLVSAFAGPSPQVGGSTVWSTMYDIRRYGGLQIFLRALYGGSLVLSSPEEPIASFLARAAAAGVTHISGTPSHWRKALMSGASASLRPSYVRLSGEIADQGILDALRAAFPQAVVAHAFASTEAGVGFEIRDGLAGFPASLVGVSEQGVEVDVSRGTLRLRSPGNAIRYLGEDAPPLRDEEGFVGLGDFLELRAGRYYFMGRSGGVINVGGLKVHPEEVEAVINAHPRVRMSLVRARRNPIMGAVVTAEVVLAEGAAGGAQAGDEALCREIQEACRAALPAHKVPALIRVVPALAVSASGKLVRPNA